MAAVHNNVHGDMRVKIQTNPPLPPVRAWFPLPFVQSTPDISSFKYLLGASLPAFRDVAPSALRLSIDGFELLDNSELTIVRDGDLIWCVTMYDSRLYKKPTRMQRRHTRRAV